MPNQLLTDIKMLKFTWLTGGEVNVLEIPYPISVEMPNKGFSQYRTLGNIDYTVDNTWQFCTVVRNR